jgi:hypothetical protein
MPELHHWWQSASHASYEIPLRAGLYEVRSDVGDGVTVYDGRADVILDGAGQFTIADFLGRVIVHLDERPRRVELWRLGDARP